MEPNNQLNEKEIEILIEAIECWEKESVGEGFNKALLSLMLPSGDKENKEERKEKMDEAMHEGVQKAQLRKETLVLLRSKLICMKNLIGVEIPAWPGTPASSGFGNSAQSTSQARIGKKPKGKTGAK